MTTRRIAIIGDGKMGKAIAQLAGERGWDVTAVLGAGESDGGRGLTKSTLGNPDVAVEFTEPAAAAANIGASLRARVPVVVGTTGWYESLPQLARIAEETKTGLLWSPNFSLGVNIFLELARNAGALMRSIESFEPHIVETHHSRKKDAPSGTAAAIAREVKTGLAREVPITSIRVGDVPGTHELVFDGPYEQLKMVHLARDRRVFAEGALRAAAWLIGRHGVFTMKDVLGTDTPAGR